MIYRSSINVYIESLLYFLFPISLSTNVHIIVAFAIPFFSNFDTCHGDDWTIQFNLMSLGLKQLHLDSDNTTIPPYHYVRPSLIFWKIQESCCE